MQGSDWLVPRYTPKAIWTGVVPPSGIAEASISLPAPLSGQAHRIELQATFSMLATSPGIQLAPLQRRSNSLAVTLLSDDIMAPAPGDRIYVDDSAAPGGDGRSWGSALTSFDLALRMASGSPDQPAEIWIAQGIYKALAVPYSNQAIFTPQSNLHIYGGFQGNETETSARVPFAFPTVLSADRLGDDLAGGYNRTDNESTLIALPYGSPAENLVIDGLEFRGCRYGGFSVSVNRALFIPAGDVTIQWCTFVDNQMTAMYLSGGGEFLVRNCRFLGNSSPNFFPNCIGGGSQGALRIQGCLFEQNNSQVIPTRGLLMTLYSFESGVVEVLNCTFRNNRYALAGSSNCGLSGSLLHFDTSIRLVNNIFYENGCGSGDPTEIEIAPSGNLVEAEYNCFETTPSWAYSPTNVFVDPQFVSPTDSHLQPSSPLIDAGDSHAVPSEFLLALDGYWRVADDPLAPNSGLGYTRFVDFGAYER